MKKILSLILVLLLCTALILPTFAATLPRFADSAGLVSESEGDALIKKLDDLSRQQNFDFAVVTIPALNGTDPGYAAADIFQSYDYGYGVNNDGILLLISEYDRDWYIYSSDIINADAREYIAESFLPDLSAGNYAKAFDIFADKAYEMLLLAQSGQRYKAPFPFVKRFLISLAISFFVALIAVGVMKSKLKSVSRQQAAANYVVPGSLNVTEARERFLYRNVSRTARSQNSSGARSSGGHSGSGGKF